MNKVKAVFVSHLASQTKNAHGMIQEPSWRVHVIGARESRAAEKAWATRRRNTRTTPAKDKKKRKSTYSQMTPAARAFFDKKFDKNRKENPKRLDVALAISYSQTKAAGYKVPLVPGRIK